MIRLLAIEIIASRTNWSFPLTVGLLFCRWIKATLTTLVYRVNVFLGRLWIECAKSTLFVIMIAIKLCMVVEVWLWVKCT